MDQSKKLLKPHELAQALRVSESWIYCHSAPNAKVKIPTKRVGGLLRYDLDEVMRALDKQGVSNAD